MATLEEVAAAAGVSRNTVSRVLSGRTKAIWPGTAARARHIRRVAARLAYRPHGAARAMSRGRFGCAALLLSTEAGRSTLPTTLLDSIHDALARRDMHLMVAKLPDEKLTSEGFVPKVLREWMSDGLLINYNRDIPRRMIELIEEHRIPAVWINCKRDADCVHPDDFGGGKAAAEHLLRLGHRRIAYAEFSTDPQARHYSEVDRREGYAEAMRAAGLPPRLLRPEPLSHGPDRVQLARRWLAGGDRPSAVVAYAFAEAVHHAATAAGLRVPHDLSVIGFAQRPDYAICATPSAVVIPAGQLGEAAVEMLADKMARPPEPLPPRVLAVRLVAGETTGPAAGGGRRVNRAAWTGGVEER